MAPIYGETREGYSKIEVCCSGYARKPHSHYECHPVCDGCEHGNCTAPGVCECKRGYILLRDTTQPQHSIVNDCVPTCPLGCLNGICTNTGVCSCNAGTVPSKDGRYCLPHCTGGCDEKTNKCGYYCEGGCGEGSCIGPNTCSCKPGYKLQRNTCIPDCPKGCLNGEYVPANLAGHWI
ncbi:unnamed protein product [Callosobruchus maculatus]|uniref:EGF-like domain-containing protein n=1 Tax=Callosobruchus maculatus TaxID=64391 RepID=A0A653CZW2_CALMS|nr:unnamed protein product [Callosobruchus maculatus]